MTTAYSSTCAVASARFAAGQCGAAGLPRLLPPALDGQPAGLAAHLARHGELPRCRPALILAEIEQAGLSGRGGAAFPTARKLSAVLAAPGRPVVVVNATEGEPASAKDKVLMATTPHLVLDGAVVAARVAGAREVIVVTHAAVTGSTADAIRARRRAGRDDVHIRVVQAADGFVAGEASAVVNWLAGGPPVPTAVPPRLAQRGLHGRPTLVQNAETLAHVALIARHGARWFRQVGTPAEPGSMLVTVIGSVRRPGVAEVAIGTPVADVLAGAGGTDGPPQALLIGGYFGTWVSWPDVADRPFSAAGLASFGAAPAAGLVAALPADACGLTETARVARYLADESAGQCGPCLFGLDAIAGTLADAAAGRRASVPQLQRWLSQVDRRGACRHPDGAVHFIRSGLALFAEELDLHSRGWCSAAAARAQEPVLPIPSRPRGG